MRVGALLVGLAVLLSWCSVYSDVFRVGAVVALIAGVALLIVGDGSADGA